MTVVFAVVTRTFNEDKLMISQRKIMYHMARSPRPPCPRAEPLMPPKPGDDDRQSRNYCESRRRPTTMHDRASVVAADPANDKLR